MKMLRIKKPSHGGKAIERLSFGFLCDFDRCSGLSGPYALVWNRLREVNILSRTLVEPIKSAILAFLS